MAGGLRPLTAALVSEQIERARELGHLDDAARDRLHERNVFAMNAARLRENQVCVALGRAGSTTPASCHY